MAITNLSDLLAAAEARSTHSASAWLTPVQHLQIFTRVQYYVLDRHQVEHVVTLANIVVAEGRQRQGIFKSYLAYVEAATDMPIVIENVHNPFLREFLGRNGYTPLENAASDCMSVTFFKRKSP